MSFGRLVAAVFGMQMMPFGCVCMVRGFFMVACIMVLCSFLMMFGSVFVMLSRFLVMFGSFFAHFLLLSDKVEV
jgi:hypothetical protein